MTAVPVTGEVRTATGRKDSRDWAAFSPVYREGTNGEVITTRGKEFPVRVVDGQFTAMLEPGVVVIVNPDDKQYTVTVPNEAADLWDLIGLSVGLPPETSQLEITDATKGIIMKSPDGTRYRITVANGGTLTVAAA